MYLGIPKYMSYLQFVDQLHAKLDPAKSPPVPSDPFKLLAKGIVDSFYKKVSNHIEM